MGDFRCPACGGTRTDVIDVRRAGAFRTRRRRECSCGHRFSTMEIPASEYKLMDGSLVASLHRDAKKVVRTIDAIVKVQEARDV